MATANAGGAISFAYLAEIAVGATARVDLCRATDGRLLAVKRLHPHIAEDPGFATQFLDEVWMTASLKHPNVVEVAGWGTDDQGSFLAVELVQGVSLSRLMKTVFDTGEQFTERMVVYVCSRLCAGLAAAHNLTSPEGELLNLVHRDLTPGNVLVGFDGDVKIADFGLAKAKLRLTKTITGMLKGQPTYMAPEQARALDIDKRADVFSLGVVLFELFAGRRPWLGSSDYEMMQRTANEPPADLRELRAKIDKELVAIVNRCLEKLPESRFQSAEEVQARLDEWLRVHGYLEGSQEAVARFVRRNAMRQMRWFERAVAGELQPQAPARVGRQLAPRDPSYANVAANPGLDAGTTSRALGVTRAGGVSSPQAIANGYGRPRIVEETTDVSDASQRMASMHGSTPQDPALQSVGRQRAASTRAARDAARPPIADNETDWGEEVPTLVQRDGSGPIGRRRVGSDANTPRQLPSILDEESDSNRTTSVKPATRVPDALRGDLPRLQPISDMDSEEAPTAPVGTMHQMVQPARARGGAATPAANPRGAAKGAIPPGVAIPQAPLARSFAAPGASQRAPSEAPPRPTGDSRRPPPAGDRGQLPAPRGGAPGRVVPQSPGVPPPPVGAAAAAAQAEARANVGAGPTANGGGALARSAVEAVRAAVSAATAEHARASQHSTQDEMSPAPMAVRRPRSAQVERDVEGVGPSSEAQPPAPLPRTARSDRPPSEELLVSEADRLAIEAVRLSEEAKGAQARADKKAAQAKIAGEAAAVAADAVRVARAAGLAAGVARLDEARRLEAGIASAVVDNSRSSFAPPPPMSSPPATFMGGFTAPPMAHGPQSYGAQPQMRPAPSAPPSSGSMGVPAGPSSSARGPNDWQRDGGVPADPYFPGGDPGSRRSNSFPPPQPLLITAAGGPARSTFGPGAFRAQLRGMFGMSSAAVVLLAFAAFLLVLVVLWLIWG